METLKLRKRLIRVSCLQCGWTHIYRTAKHGHAAHEAHRLAKHPTMFDAFAAFSRQIA